MKTKKIGLHVLLALHFFWGINTYAITCKELANDLLGFGNGCAWSFSRSDCYDTWGSDGEIVHYKIKNSSCGTLNDLISPNPTSYEASGETEILRLEPQNDGKDCQAVTKQTTITKRRDEKKCPNNSFPSTCWTVYTYSYSFSPGDIHAFPVEEKYNYSFCRSGTNRTIYLKSYSGPGYPYSCNRDSYCTLERDWETNPIHYDQCNLTSLPRGGVGPLMSCPE